VSARLFVDNLPAGTTEEALRSLFGRGGGSVLKVSIMSDRQTGESHGYAFVDMATSAEAASAMRALHNHSLHGVRLHVSLARAPADMSKAGS
jgi:RNA recognition motif-containing protein